MKKLLSVMLIITLAFGLAACGGHPNKKGIVGVWHVVDEETETDYGLGIEFTKDGKVRYGLTEDVFTALADGNEKDAESAMKALDVLVKMEYEIKSDTEIEITTKALMGIGGKETDIISYSLDGDSLTFDGTEFARVTEESKKEAEKKQKELAKEKEKQQKEAEKEKEKQEKQAKKNGVVAEYDSTAWVKDNTSVSFYFMYQEGKEDNELLTLKMLDKKAVLYSKKGEGEQKPITIYEETDEGIVTTQLLYVGDKKGAFQYLPKEGYTLREYIPKTGNILATFGARGDKDTYRNREISRTDKFIGRKCNVIENANIAGKTTVMLDQETGIVLKSETLLKSGDTETRLVQAWVTELVYGKVKEADVTVDLSDYELTVEEPQEETKEADAE